MMNEYFNATVMGFSNIFMVLWWAFVVVMVVLLVRGLRNFPEGGEPQGDKTEKTPLEILQARYAQGEIDQEEYESKRRDLET